MDVNQLKILLLVSELGVFIVSHNVCMLKLAEYRSVIIVPDPRFDLEN